MENRNSHGWSIDYVAIQNTVMFNSHVKKSQMAIGFSRIKLTVIFGYYMIVSRSMVRDEAITNNTRN